MINQKMFTEDVLFNYYMPSNSEENIIHSQIPFYLESQIHKKMVRYSEVINNICIRFLRELKGNHKKLITYIDDFPYKQRIFNLDCKLSPLLWTRFDVFKDSSNEVKFAEFNYDKPCAQKEIGLAGSIPFEGNINKNFERKLKEEIKNICTINKREEKITKVAILMDPCHYEELHVSFYLASLFQEVDIKILSVGPKNFSVKNNKVYAFGSEEIDVILRLFPVEYLYEVNDIDKILDCYERGSVLLLNDPRVIAIQAKSFFAYLWELVESNSILLSKEEIEIIKACIPYSKIFSRSQLDEVLQRKDSYVIKSSFGRYSGEVYIGKLYTPEGWKRKIDEVLKSNNIHILQDVIDIKKEYTYHVNEYGMNVPCIAYGNFGTFIINDKVEGICVRWSDTFLTDNSSTWMCAVGVKDYPIALQRYDTSDRKEVWDKVAERAMFEYEFTGQYININEYISLNNLILDAEFKAKIDEISIKYCEILNKTSKLIEENFDMFSTLLGIPEKLKEVILNSYTDSFCAIGRIDMVMDNTGEIKILEFNSETPAGLVESIGVQNIIKEELAIKHIDPNKNLKINIKNTFEKILKDFSRNREIKNVAFVCTTYHEDWYNTSILKDICNKIEGYNIILGNIYDLEVREEKLYLYGTPLDAIYRFFPLDWFAQEEDLQEVLKVLNKETYSINPTHTLITQSKAIYAVIYELIGTGFFNTEEEIFISKHLPYTCLGPNEKLSYDCMSKPYLSREGKGIVMSYEGFDKDEVDVIYQERANIVPIEMIKYTAMSAEEKYQFPVIGVYITGNTPSGIFTRMGDFITNQSASFVPTFIKNNFNI